MKKRLVDFRTVREDDELFTEGHLFMELEPKDCPFLHHEVKLQYNNETVIIVDMEEVNRYGGPEVFVPVDVARVLPVWNKGRLAAKTLLVFPSIADMLREKDALTCEKGIPELGVYDDLVTLHEVDWSCIKYRTKRALVYKPKRNRCLEEMLHELKGEFKRHHVLLFNLNKENGDGELLRLTSYDVSVLTGILTKRKGGFMAPNGYIGLFNKIQPEENTGFDDAWFN